ncbi:axonemal dynein light chain domain-containing protein 1 isoform X3 [Lepisosteus oculatus]|uniref:axonemal dynein light chain domain-containing protein 1 isoform X3 n=1 Tax=Lepisosteus oculatus TaxID=7918 RepID=UPI0037171C7B
MSIKQPSTHSPPTVPKTKDRRIKPSQSMSIAERDRELAELKEKLVLLEPTNPIPTSLKNDFIPDEILLTLTSTVKPSSPTHVLGPPRITRTPKEFKGHGLRGADPVWRYPERRNKYKYFFDQPTSVTGAGRDISFLCDGIASKRAITPVPSPSDVSCAQDKQDHFQNASKELGLMESLIPEEYHIVKNKGVLGLECYEDKYTVLLEDSDKRLRVFPSLKPSGRLEAVQLMRVMDTMLEKAGISDDISEVTDLSQMHSLLELVKIEQNIYNVVFHELIRQITVECAERGKLLSKLRQRYILLLDRIPRQLKSLHTETVALRALDRRLTEEIVCFKTSIGQLHNELTLLRQHDLRVSKAAECAQEEMARVLQQAQKNADLVGEYHELYEMQRRRLESQVSHLTEERDLWSRVTYSLALKVIKANNLHFASKLQISEQTWSKTAEHFTILLMSKDTEDFGQILQLADQWKSLVGHFMQDLRQSENSVFEKVKMIEARIAKWQKLYEEKVKANEGSQKDLEQDLFQELKQWQEMLTYECERYGGDKLLSSQETLKTMVQLQEKWMDLALVLFRRHPGPDGETSHCQVMMMDLGRILEELHKQLGIRITGESGIHKIMLSLVGEIEFWSSRLSAVSGLSGGLPYSDWLKLQKAFSGWSKFVEETFQLIDCTHPESDQLKQKAYVRVDIEEAFHKQQEFLSMLSNIIEFENYRLKEECSAIHISLTQWILDLLLQMVPDCCDEKKLQPSSEKEAKNVVAIKRLEEDAMYLTQKLDHFSKYLTSSCQAIVEEDLQKHTAEDEPVDGLYELTKLQVEQECSEWLETCQILLSEIKGCPLEQLAPSTQVVSFVTDLPPVQDSEESVEAGASPVESVEISKETSSLRFIGHDGNIQEKTLRELTVPLKEDDDVVDRPETPNAQRAFEALAAVDVLQRELLSAEERAQRAEKKALSTEEQLRSALEKIQNLEQQLKGRTNLEDMDEKKVVPSKVQLPREVVSGCSKSTLKIPKSEKSSKKS